MVHTVSAVAMQAVAVYLPATQLVHVEQAATLEAVEYVLPATQDVQVLAPVPVTPVIEPAAHTAHVVVVCALAAAATYWLAGHTVPHTLSAVVEPAVCGVPALHTAL